MKAGLFGVAINDSPTWRYRQNRPMPPFAVHAMQDTPRDDAMNAIQAEFIAFEQLASICASGKLIGVEQALTAYSSAKSSF